MTVPQSIVGKDKTTGSENTESHLVGLPIGTLVTIDKRKVELDTEFGSLCDSIADDKRDLVADRGVLNPRTGEVLLLVVDLKGIEMTVGIQSLCHAQGGVAAEGAYL